MTNSKEAGEVTSLRGRAADWVRNVRQRLSPGKSLVIGLLLGASAMGLRSCGEEAKEHDHAAATPSEAATSHWTCSMHPQIHQQEPGACPICGMDLIPVAQDDAGSEQGPPTQVVLSPRARALAQLRTTTVHRQANPEAELQLLGRFEPNETTLRSVTAWTGGRIDRLHVNVTGERVRGGQVVATLYSPEVFAAHQDLLVAKRQVERMESSPEASRRAAEAALSAARERLRLLGLPDDELARMETVDRPTRSVSVRSPFSGTVMERLATEGAYISTGTPLYRVANLSTLWLQLDAYENDLSRLSEGQPVAVTVEALPGEGFEGKVTFIEPTVDPERRTARVRVEVGNESGQLRPGMFAEATIAASDGVEAVAPLVIPKSAPLFTGRRAIVYVEHVGEDRVAYEPRTVRLGPLAGDVYPVVAGLMEGERIVTRGAFALDADLQIRGGPSMMASGDDRDEGSWDGGLSLAPGQREQLAPAMRAYLEIQTGLADDSLNAATAGAERMVSALKSIELDGSASIRQAWSESSATLEEHATRIATATSLESAREGFEPLSETVIEVLARFGNPLNESLRLAFCPMASGSAGARWIQSGSEVDNSYFGASMLSCGEVRQEVPPAAYLSAPPGGGDASKEP